MSGLAGLFNIGECTVLGPLPKMYRVLVSVIALSLFVGAGVWVALVLPYHAYVSYGVTAGLVAGAICAFLLVHDSQRTAAPHRVRRTTHRH